MKKIAPIIAILVLVGVVGTTTALYTKTWNPQWNPFRPSPDEVMESMTTKMSDIKTVHSETILGIEVKDEDNEFSIDMTISGDEDHADVSNPKSKGDLSASISSGGLTASAAMEFITVGQVFYLKLTTIPLPSLFGQESESILQVLDTVKDQWIKIDPESMKDFSEDFGGEYQSSLSKEAQEELKNKLVDLFKDSKFYEVKEELPDEKMEGEMTYHYILTLNKEGIKELVPKMIKLAVESYKESNGEIEIQEEEMNQALEEEFPKSVDEFFEATGPIDFEVWIGQDDMYLYRAKIEKEIDLGNFKESFSGSIGESVPVEDIGKVFTSMDIKLSKFNQPVQVEAPEEFKTLQEVITSIMMGFFTGGYDYPETPGMPPGMLPGEGMPY